MLASTLRNHCIKQPLINLLFFVFASFALLFSYFGMANAALLVFSSDVVVDNRGTAALTDDLFFYRDLSRFSDMTYAEQLVSIDALNTELNGAGPWNNNWHLATSSEMSGLFADSLGVTGVFLPSVGSDYFAGRYEVAVIKDEPEHMWYEVILMSGGVTYTEQDSIPDSSDYDGAWAVATYRVPEPSTLLLVITSLAGMIWQQRRISKT
jgi:hypothetical protein